MALSMKSYQALKEHIDIIHKADENYARHMWDEEKLDALNDFIEALADLATDVEFCILYDEMPEEEKNRLARLEIEDDMREVTAM
jgi:hypothetical protein